MVFRGCKLANVIPLVSSWHKNICRRRGLLLVFKCIIYSETINVPAFKYKIKTISNNRCC